MYLAYKQPNVVFYFRKCSDEDTILMKSITKQITIFEANLQQLKINKSDFLNEKSFLKCQEDLISLNNLANEFYKVY